MLSASGGVLLLVASWFHTECNHIKLFPKTVFYPLPMMGNIDIMLVSLLPLKLNGVNSGAVTTSVAPGAT